MHPDILARILDWATKRPNWQQDALHRLLCQGHLTEADELELYQCCRAENGLSAIPATILAPLTVPCLPADAATADDVTLLSISNPVHVNSLAANQTLHFQPHGLSIVYGANGAGKSSYARILRRLCHSRSTPAPILPNVYQPLPETPASAVIEYQLGEQPKTLSWSPQNETPTPLKSVRLYDAECAKQHVGEAGEVNAPMLDVLYELGALCQQFQQRLKDDKKALAKQKPDWSDKPPVATESTVYALLKNPAGADLPPPLDETAQARHRHLALLLLQGPAQAAQWYQQQAEALQQLYDDLLAAQTALSDKCVTRQQRREAEVAEDIAATRKILQANDTQAALQLAQQYIDHHAHGDDFEAHENCPLCRQAAVQAQRERWRGLRFVAGRLLTPGLRRFSVTLRLRRRAALRRQPAPNLSTSPLPSLAQTIAELRNQAAACRALENPAQHAELLTELNELKARQWLDENRQAVEAEIARLAELNRLEQAIRETGTKAISLESRKLAELFVTDALRQRFLEELKRLGFSHKLPVEFDAAAAKNGSMHYQIRLAGAVVPAYLPNVLSEGEQQCIALAGFLTELVADQSRSALVFDDPMSSLDHLRREQVANRLVAEAQHRQVVIFTHDLVFLLNLQEAARQQQVPTKVTQLSRTLNKTGMCLADAPWPGMPVSKRVAHLNQYLRATKSYWAREAYDDYQFRVRAFYSLLRETWERVVEETLLNGVVARFERAVHTRPLRKLTDICENDINTIEAAMSKCSNFMLGHDEAPALNSRLPDFDELQADLAALKQFSETVRKRRRESN